MVDNDIKRSGETVVVEHSDERLASAEEAKRTGQEFQSIGARGTDIVDREVLRAEVEKVSNENSSSATEQMPDYLVSLRQGLDDEIAVNEQKAKEHGEYSADVVRAQEKAAVGDAEKLRVDPEHFAKRIAANNVKLAEAHTEESAKYAADVARREDGVAEEIRKLRPIDAQSERAFTVLGQNAKGVTDISESAASEALVTKDKIIFGEESFKQQAKATRKVVPSNERAIDTSETNEPKRVDEPVRKGGTPKSMEEARTPTKEIKV